MNAKGKPWRKWDSPLFFPFVGIAMCRVTLRYVTVVLCYCVHDFTPQLVNGSVIKHKDDNGLPTRLQHQEAYCSRDKYESQLNFYTPAGVVIAHQQNNYYAFSTDYMWFVSTASRFNLWTMTFIHWLKLPLFSSFLLLSVGQVSSETNLLVCLTIAPYPPTVHSVKSRPVVTLILKVQSSKQLPHLQPILLDSHEWKKIDHFFFHYLTLGVVT